jgi:hypothetical protein
VQDMTVMVSSRLDDEWTRMKKWDCSIEVIDKATEYNEEGSRVHNRNWLIVRLVPAQQAMLYFLSICHELHYSVKRDQEVYFSFLTSVLTILLT